MSLKGTWAQIYREDATGLGYTVAPTTMPLTISDDSNDIRDVGPSCGYEDYYAESPMLPTTKARARLVSRRIIIDNFVHRLVVVCYRFCCIKVQNLHFVTLCKSWLRFPSSNIGLSSNYSSASSTINNDDSSTAGQCHVHRSTINRNDDDDWCYITIIPNGKAIHTIPTICQS